jgi:RNA polymerase sigma-70 factor (ECF subfamily)
LSQCRDPDNFAGWFFLILRNRCFAERRRDKRFSGLEEAGDVPTQNEDPGRPLERMEDVRALQRALLELTAEQREVFVLKHVDGLTYETIAAQTGATVASLKMRMHRAYDRLRDLLKDKL